jgi:hypothetical protein
MSRSSEPAADQPTETSGELHTYDRDFERAVRAFRAIGKPPLSQETRERVMLLIRVGLAESGLSKELGTLRQLEGGHEGEHLFNHPDFIGLLDRSIHEKLLQGFPWLEPYKLEEPLAAPLSSLLCQDPGLLTSMGGLRLACLFKSSLAGPRATLTPDERTQARRVIILVDGLLPLLAQTELLPLQLRHPSQEGKPTSLPSLEAKIAPWTITPEGLSQRWPHMLSVMLGFTFQEDPSPAVTKLIHHIAHFYTLFNELCTFMVVSRSPATAREELSAIASINKMLMADGLTGFNRSEPGAWITNFFRIHVPSGNPPEDQTPCHMPANLGRMPEQGWDEPALGLLAFSLFFLIHFSVIKPK